MLLARLVAALLVPSSAGVLSPDAAVKSPVVDRHSTSSVLFLLDFNPVA